MMNGKIFINMTLLLQSNKNVAYMYIVYFKKNLVNWKWAAAVNASKALVTFTFYI